MASPFRLSANSVKDLTQYIKKILETHKAYTDLHNKMEAIDEAYYRYSIEDENGVDTGTDAANTECDATESDITVPIVISQVDSFVGYMADVYLTGYPMFPVVSEPRDKAQAELLESIIDNHSILGGYARQFLLAFRDGMKYNFMPIEHSWEPIDKYKVVTDYLKPTEAAKLDAAQQNYTCIKRHCPYNTVWDFRKSPADVCFTGEYAGYIDLETRIPLRQFINRESPNGTLYNITELNSSKLDINSQYWKEPPLVNRYISNRKRNLGFDWFTYLGASNTQNPSTRTRLQAGVYEQFSCYARIIPSEFGITNVPKPNSPSIWHFKMINGQLLIYAKPIFTMFDVLPMLIGQPNEDGFNIQTESVGEAQIPFQEAATTLFDIRFNSARRSVSDRALYDSTLINPSDVNTKEPAPKIPVRLSGLNSKKLADAYEQIPFDSRGTDTVLTDMRNILDLSDKLSGFNKPGRGEFQKGNKSVQEWQDTMGGSDNRLRLPALMTEFQVMMPIKEGIKLNIFQHGVKGVFQNMNTGNSYTVDAAVMTRLQETVLNFRIADGFTPKSKMASTDFLGKLMESLSQNQQLAMSWGPGLPAMFAHLAQLGGVRGLEQYLPATPTAPAVTAPGVPSPQQQQQQNTDGQPAPTA